MALDERGTVLVSGVSGFIGRHIAREFLEHGYPVRGTLRSLDKADSVRACLAGHVDVGGLDFAEADLMSDEGWTEVLSGVRHVVHSASPFPLSQPKDPNVLVRPAVDGTMRVLQAATAAGAESFVQTSSIAAITPGHGGRVCTADDWADLGSPSATPYVLSKTLAERTARDSVAGGTGSLRYMSVNPGFVLGPLLDASAGTSADVVSMMLTGKYPAVPRVQFSIVDVRDVAAAHRLAVEKGKPGGRYVATSGSLWMREMAQVLRRALGERARKVPRSELPDFLVRVLGVFDRSVRTILPDLGVPVRVDASRTSEELGIAFRPAEEAVVAMAESLVAFGRA